MLDGCDTFGDMDFDRQFSLHLEAVEAALDNWLPAAAAAPPEIHAAMRYCLAAGGKRLRPVLLLAAARLFPPLADPLPAAAAIECVHTYSLIHDDLPCMDDSPLRRGRPSAHIQFGEATAVLAGDALLTEAFAILGRAYAEQPALGLTLVRLLGAAAGSARLIGGQTVDTLRAGRQVAAAELDYIHLNKTAALLGAALRMGLALTAAPALAAGPVDALGRHLGLAFQIVDDILDATADSATLGKTAGSDARQQKNTYVRCHGLAASRQAARQHTESALAALAEIPADTTFLASLVRDLENRLR
jgi:geranylgeranyl pyrophosphate synthase